MKLSTDRILTTHVGSLPRSAAVESWLIKKENGEQYDQQEFDGNIREGVIAAVKQQAQLGIDVVSDGETSKIGYATYIKDRFSGFGGDYTAKPHLDMAPHPDLRERMMAFTGPQNFKRMCCIGKIRLEDEKAVNIDTQNFRAALDSLDSDKGVVEGFINAASPGVVSSFLPNQFYENYTDYIQAVADAIQAEYEAIVGAGFLLQVDCPDLAMSRHTGFQDLSEAEFLQRAEQNIDVLNHALRNIPEESLRMHVCWGNYEGPHDYDIAVEKILPIIFRAKPQAICFEAANPRHAHEWAAWKQARIPDHKVLIPGVIDSCSNYVDHPELVAQRIQTFADIVGRERVLAGTDCGFGTFAGYGKVVPDVAYKKLASLVEGAKIASKKLWE